MKSQEEIICYNKRFLLTHLISVGRILFAVTTEDSCDRLSFSVHWPESQSDVKSSVAQLPDGFLSESPVLEGSVRELGDDEEAVSCGLHHLDFTSFICIREHVCVVFEQEV